MEKCKSRMQLESYIHTPKTAKECEGMNLDTLKWIPTLKVGVPMDFFEYSKSNLRGQN
jgi:hypothetical protein